MAVVHSCYATHAEPVTRPLADIPQASGFAFDYILPPLLQTLKALEDPNPPQPVNASRYVGRYQQSVVPCYESQCPAEVPPLIPHQPCFGIRKLSRTSEPALAVVACVW